MREWNFWETSRDIISIQIPFIFIFVPFPKGEKSSQTVNHSLIWSAGWAFYQHPADAHSNPQHTNPRTFALPLPWIRGWISTFCPVFRRLQEEKREAAFVVIEALTGWCHVITVQTGGGGSLGWRWQYTKTYWRDRNAYYTGANGHKRPEPLCLMSPTNKQQPVDW